MIWFYQERISILPISHLSLTLIQTVILDLAILEKNIHPFTLDYFGLDSFRLSFPENLFAYTH